MAVIDGIKQNFDSLSSFTFSVHFLFDNALQKFAPFHFFHDHVGYVRCLKDVMKANNVRTTAKELQGFNLILESTLSTAR